MPEPTLSNEAAEALRKVLHRIRVEEGVPPWQISGADPAKVQVFFQGRRIALPEPAPPRFVLQAVRLTP